MIILHNKLSITFYISMSESYHPGLNHCLVFPRMVNTHNNPALPEQAEGSRVGGTNLPPPPSLAEVMLEAERNKRETNRLLERIEQNTAHHQRTKRGVTQ